MRIVPIQSLPSLLSKYTYRYQTQCQDKRSIWNSNVTQKTSSTTMTVSCSSKQRIDLQFCKISKPLYGSKPTALDSSTWPCTQIRCKIKYLTGLWDFKWPETRDNTHEGRKVSEKVLNLPKRMLVGAGTAPSPTIILMDLGETISTQKTLKEEDSSIIDLVADVSDR